MAEIEVTLFDGRGEALARAQQDVLLSVRDGRQASFHRHFVKGPTIRVETDFHGTPQDAHVVLASLKRHRDCGFMPVTVAETGATPVALMLMPSLSALQGSYYALYELLAGLAQRLGLNG